MCSRIIFFVFATTAIVVATVRADQPRQAAPKGYRKLGPGVETTIPAKPETDDTVTRHDMVEIQAAGKKLDWTPETQSSGQRLKVLTKDIPFRRGVWYLEFAFKPLRMIDVDMPTDNGRMERRQIWYMVYRVKNLGQHLSPDSDGDKNQSLAANPATNEEIYFHPQFVLEGEKYKKAYLDRVLPLAVAAIEKRDDSRRQLLDSVQMSEHPIPLSTAEDDKSVWGVATWEHVDPKMDYFSIYVKGLTNAYRFADPTGAYDPEKEPGNGRIIAQKTLKLNFWRPGDQYDPNEFEIYYGVPGQVDHEWVFR
jgi:hypothetical protein